jgi:hypothetical protein
LIDKWDLGPLTARVQHANSFADAIRSNGTPRDDTPTSLPVPAAAMAMRAEQLPVGAADDSTPDELAEPENDLQRSLMVFTEHLETSETKRSKMPQKMMSSGPIANGELAKRRVEAFLDQQSEVIGNRTP